MNSDVWSVPEPRWLQQHPSQAAFTATKPSAGLTPSVHGETEPPPRLSSCAHTMSPHSLVGPDLALQGLQSCHPLASHRPVFLAPSLGPLRPFHPPCSRHVSCLPTCQPSVPAGLEAVQRGHPPAPPQPRHTATVRCPSDTRGAPRLCTPLAQPPCEPSPGSILSPFVSCTVTSGMKAADHIGDRAGGGGGSASASKVAKQTSNPSRDERQRVGTCRGEEILTILWQNLLKLLEVGI